MLDDYLREDPTLELLRISEGWPDAEFASHRWLLESAPKRLVYQLMYGDLLTTRGKSVLDIGGGYCSLSRRLIERHTYTLIDTLDHDRAGTMRDIERQTGKPFWFGRDWNEYSPPAGVDVVIANDLFPNVDQRLELFLDRFLPSCREMRLSLTYHNEPHFYRVKRLDADEIMCLSAWPGAFLALVLNKHIDRIFEPRLEELYSKRPSQFTNGRQVCIVRLRGDSG